MLSGIDQDRRELLFDVGGNRCGFSCVRIEEHLNNLIGRVQNAGVDVEHPHKETDAFATDSCHPTIDANEVTGFGFLNERGRRLGGNRMDAVLVDKALQADAKFRIKMEHRIIKKMRVVAHVHVPKLVVMPRVDYSA